MQVNLDSWFKILDMTAFLCYLRCFITLLVSNHIKSVPLYTVHPPFLTVRTWKWTFQVDPTQPSPNLVGTSLPCKLIQGGDRVVGHHGSHTNAWPGFGWVKREAPRNGYGNSKMDMPENSRELDMEPRFEHFLPHKKIYRLHDIHNHTWTTTITT